MQESWWTEPWRAQLRLPLVRGKFQRVFVNHPAIGASDLLELSFDRSVQKTVLPDDKHTIGRGDRVEKLQRAEVAIGQPKLPALDRFNYRIQTTSLLGMPVLDRKHVTDRVVPRVVNDQ